MHQAVSSYIFNGKDFLPIILFPAKLSVKCESRIKMFLDVQVTPTFQFLWAFFVRKLPLNSKGGEIRFKKQNSERRAQDDSCVASPERPPTESEAEERKKGFGKVQLQEKVSDVYEQMESTDRHVTDVGAFEEKLKIHRKQEKKWGSH